VRDLASAPRVLARYLGSRPRPVSLYFRMRRVSQTSICPVRPYDFLVETPSTLPSQENQGRLPGETPAGVGALPGKESETGVAVLSDERGERFVIRYYIELTGGPSGTSAQASSTTDRSMKDVMNSFAGSASTGGTGIDQPTDAMVPASAVSASAPEFTTRSALPTDSNTMGASTTNSTGQSSNFTSTSATAVSMTDNDDLVPSAGISGSRAYIGLAAALPSTFLGQGADHGATNGKNKLGIKEYSGPPSSSFATSSGPESNSLPGINESSATTPVSLSPSSAGAPDTRYSNDRTTSSASVTAIRGGTEGSRPSPLAAQPVTVGSTDSSAGNVVTTEQKSTTAGTGPNHTTSLSPGDEKDAVGHPSTMGMSGTSREPGSYPIADRGSSKTAASALGGNAAGKATSSPSKSMSSSGTQTGTQTSSGTQTGTLGSAGTIEPRSSTASTPTTPSSTAKTPSTPTTASSTTAATSTSPSTPKSPAGHTSAAQKTTSATSSVQKTASPTKDASVHQRTASNVSSEGGKKKGFMSKLKEKLAS